MPRILFYLLTTIILLQGCSRISLIYDFAPLVLQWELDSYFDLSTEQQDWVEMRLKQYFAWHRKEELPIYIEFLHEVQRRGGDGLNLSEVEEGNARMQQLWNRISDHLLSDCAYFLASLETRQIDYLEDRFHEENLEREESLTENSVERKEEHLEVFIDTIEDWFGELSDSQKQELGQIQADWYRFRQNSDMQRNLHRKERQQIFLSFLRGNPSQEETYAWLDYWFHNWSDPNDPDALVLRKKRIQRNMKRILQVDALFTQSQRQHALEKIQDWIEQMKRALPNQ